MTTCVLDYARRHGLAIDHRAETPESHLASCSRYLHTEINGLREFEPPSPLPLLQEEKFELSQEAGRILTLVVRSPAQPGWDALLEDPHKTEKLKMEAAMLRADHKKDMKWFRSRPELRRFFDEVRPTIHIVDLGTKHFTDFEVDCLKACDDVQHELQRERLEVNKQTLNLLAYSTRSGCSSEEDKSWTQSWLSAERARMRSQITPLANLPQLDLVTPPTAPLVNHRERSITPCPNTEPESNLGPEDDSPTTESGYGMCDLQASKTSELNAAHLGDGATHNTPQACSENVSGCRNKVDPRSTSKTIRTIDTEMRLEIPNLPSIHIMHPIVGQDQLDLIKSFLSSDQVKAAVVDAANETPLNWTPVSSHSAQLLLEESIEPTDVLQRLTRQPQNVIRSEQLLWKEPGLRLLDMDGSDTNETMKEMEYYHPVELAIEHQTLDVRPNEGERHNETDMEGQVGRQNDIRRVVAAPDQPKLFDDIQYTQDETLQDRKPLKPLGLRVNKTVGSQSTSRSHLFTEGIHPRAKDLVFKQRAVSNAAQSSSTFGSLETFLDLQGKRFKKPISPGKSESWARDCHDDPIEGSQLSDPATEKQIMRTHGHELPETAVSCPIQIPSTPSQTQARTQSTAESLLEPLQQPVTVIADSSLVTRRSLMAMLDNEREPKLNVIYRDLQNSPDIVLSPRTCLMYADSQALIQKNLPGQSSKNILHEKIMKIAVAYESVYILISAAEHMTAAEEATGSDFTFFCASMQLSQGVRVIPIWLNRQQGVTAGLLTDPKAVATWQLIVRYALRDIELLAGAPVQRCPLRLIQDETVWESFLVTAEVNPMAAQVVLGMMKREDIEAGPDTVWGLRQLVRMSPGERLSRFSEAVGEVCIERLNHVLEMKWT